MIRLAVIISLSACFAILVSWLSDQPGQTIISWQGVEVELRTSLALGLVAGALIILWCAERLVRSLLSWPGLISHNWRERRRQDGETALGLGMVAFAAGDIKLARKQARKAEKLLGSNKLLPSLLSAQTAHALGDKRAALRYFKMLSEDKQTAYFGHIGLMRLYQSDGRAEHSRMAATQALSHNTQSVPAHIRLVADDLAAQNWERALDRVDVMRAAEPEQHLDQSDASEMAHGPLANLDLLAAHLALRLARGAENNTSKLKWLKRAQSYQAPLIEPALEMAEIQAEHNKRTAIKTLETDFIRCPHTAHAHALKPLTGDNDGQHIARLGRLAERSDDRIAATLVMAEQALDCGIWAAAQAALEHIPAQYRHTSFYLLAARLAETRLTSGEDEMNFMSKDEALLAAAHASAGRGYYCASCHQPSDYMLDDCNICSATGQIGWMKPPSIQTAARLTERSE